MADMELDMVADKEVDKVADRVAGYGCWLIRPKPFRPKLIRLAYLLSEFFFVGGFPYPHQ